MIIIDLSKFSKTRDFLLQLQLESCMTNIPKTICAKQNITILFRTKSLPDQTFLSTKMSKHSCLCTLGAAEKNSRNIWIHFLDFYSYLNSGIHKAIIFSRIIEQSFAWHDNRLTEIASSISSADESHLVVFLVYLSIWQSISTLS